ncbi:thioredoxin-disulfide reductase [Patescibacteria group bacterium]|nr:thioredoxin-disulfide reductase [Patescibacteria group bacterium]
MADSILYTKKPSKGEPWDVAIIGSGPAGLTSAIYTTRGAASTIIFAGEKWGGQLMLTTDVDNFPGFPDGIQGPDLMAQMRKQAERFGAEFVEKNVNSVEFSSENGAHKLFVGEKEYLAKAVIIATGAEIRWLDVAGEDKFRGRGISSCAPCDAPFFKNKKVAVIGGGDSAMEEALVLTKYATSVTIFHRKGEFRASATMQKKVFDDKKINVVWDSVVEEFVGDKVLEKLKVRNVKTNEISEHEFDGAFIAIGHKPSTDIFKGKLDLDEKGYIQRTKEYKMMTSVPGVFVAGDVHDYHYKQAVTAAGFGCQAAMEVLQYLDKSTSS